MYAIPKQHITKAKKKQMEKNWEMQNWNSHINNPDITSVDYAYCLSYLNLFSSFS